MKIQALYLLEKNLHISRPVQFKPMLFKGQLYMLLYVGVFNK